eukprot:6194777-Karenia_brevis.AAC.1
MTALRSPDDNVIKRTLQRLHVRWYHATAQQMSQVLRASGVPNKAIEHVPDIVNGCMICRDWHRP